MFSSINGGLVDKKFATTTDNYILMDKNSIKSLRFLSNNSWSDVEKIKIPNNSLEKLRVVMRKYIQAITNSQINSEKFISKVS